MPSLRTCNRLVQGLHRVCNMRAPAHVCCRCSLQCFALRLRVRPHVDPPQGADALLHRGVPGELGSSGSSMHGVPGEACALLRHRTMQDLDEEQAADRERKERAEAAKSEFEKLQADRRALPIYPYREQLLQVGGFRGS